MTAAETEHAIQDALDCHGPGGGALAALLGLPVPTPTNRLITTGET